MPMRPAHGSISRPTIIWLVVAGVLIASGIGVYFAISAGSASPPRQGPAVNLDPPALPPQPPPSDLLNTGAFSGENGRAQFADKDDPSRLAGEMLYRRFDPLPRGRYQLEAPQLWLFLKDGRAVHLEAARGNVKLFTGTQKPESGRFERGVVARIYAAGVATPAARPDPSITRPELLAYSESLVFDLAVFEFTTDDVINLSTPDLEIQGEGLNVVVDEVRESLASVRLGAVGYIHVRDGGNKKPDAPRDETPPPAAPDHNATPPGVAAAPPPAPPKIDLYAITITGPVALTVGTQQPQSITADTLLAWARLVDGKLPPNAIAELGAAATAAPPPPTAPTTPAASERTASAVPPSQPSTRGMRDRLESLRIAGPGGISPLTPIADEDALLTWGGELAATAIEPAPPELQAEQVAVRFVSAGDTPVMLMDARSGATVLCRSAHYGATTAAIDLQPRDDGVITIADARQGFGELRGLTLNLKTGIGQSRGRGFFARHAHDAPSTRPASTANTQQRLAWTDQADFVFATDASSNAGIRAIRSAVFAGAVSGRTGEAEVTGDVLRAWFEPGAARDALLQRVVVEGNATGRTTGNQEPQSLRAAAFDMSFSPDEKGDESHPRLLVATGGVKGQRTELVEDPADPSKKSPQTSDLTCNELEADLARDHKGNVLVTTALARGDALFTRSDGIRAAGDEIRTGVADKTADILGPAATVAARGASLSAPDLHLDSASNAVLAKGAGTLVHTDPDAAHAESSRAPALPPDLIGRTTLTWTKGMRYDNTSGEGEAVGAVVAVTYPDPFTHNTVKGEHVKILTAPVTPPSGEAPAPASEVSVLGNVRLLRAEAVAAPPGEPGGTAPAKATAEQRTYTADPAAPDGRRLEKLVYIEGPRLIADEQNGEFSIPAAGRALFLDHSIAERPENRTATGAFSSMGGRGTTLFEWSGAMILRRFTQDADINGGVRITHKPLSEADKPITLEADGVEAKFRLADPQAQPGAKDQLERVTARGTVRIVSENGDQELTADEATYDAANEIVEAAATTEYGSVTFMDKTRAVPTIAKRLRWNLRTDEITILQPMPIIMPTK